MKILVASGFLILWKNILCIGFGFDTACLRRHFNEKILDLKFLLGTIWSKNKRTPIKLFQSELWRCDDDSILTTQPLVSLIYSVFETAV
jgi:hypothetical protein